MEYRKVKCKCECHTDNQMIHFMPCCSDGYNKQPIVKIGDLVQDYWRDQEFYVESVQEDHVVVSNIKRPDQVEKWFHEFKKIPNVGGGQDASKTIKRHISDGSSCEESGSDSDSSTEG